MRSASPGPLPARTGPIVLVGFMGAGKSTVGRRLARRLRMPFVDSDDQIQTLAGRSVRQIFDTDGEVAFRDLERSVVAGLVTAAAGTPAGAVLALGGGAAQDPATRTVLAGCRVVHLEVSLAQVRARVGADRGRPMLDRPGLADLHRERARVFAELAEVTVCTDGRTPAAVEAMVAELLGY